MKKIYLLGLFLFFSNFTYSQSCGFDIQRDQSRKNPNYIELEKAAEQKIKDVIKNRKYAYRSSTTVLTIPVVVHVLHLGEAVGIGTNISTAQIQSSIVNLNNFYRGRTANSTDFKIEFILAKRDPNCNTTTGINRINASAVPNYTDDGVKLGDNGTGAEQNDLKDLSRWPETEYLNIWIVSEINGNDGGIGVQGYANFFRGFAYEGSVMMHTAFGSDPNNSTVVHEIGHYFHLYHTFQGDDADSGSGYTAQCPTANGTNIGTDSDGCADTVPHKRETSTCPAQNSCSNSAWVDNNTKNNMMSYYRCKDKMTADQKTRVRAAMEGTSIVSSKGGLVPDVNFSVVASCTTNSVSSSASGIVRVALNGVTLTSGSSYQDGGNIDKSTDCVNFFEIDTAVTNTLNVGMFSVNTQQLGIWIDWNDDGDFEDDAEQQYLSGGIAQGATITHTLTYPVNIPYNDYVRIRLVTDLDGYQYAPSTLSACSQDLFFGQSEDYAIFVKPTAANRAPVIGGVSAEQTVDDNATITLFSAITTTDADGADNLTATITLDNNAKGVITGADSGSGPYMMTSKTPAAMQIALRALVFNPTDNRATVSETTTFTVVIYDATDSDTDSATTVISSAVAPIFSAVSPGSNSTVVNANVGYTLSEALASGSVTYTRTGGPTDFGAPHSVDLAETELNSGVRAAAALTISPNLVSGTIYTIDFTGTDSGGKTATTVSATNVTFITPTAPTVTTIVASSIAATSAALGGNATADGGTIITETGVVYSITGTNSNPLINGADVTKEMIGSGTGVFSQSISNLTLGTGYSFKAYAINDKGTSYGAVQTFTTLANETNMSATAGNWSETSNWSLGRVPIATDNIEISAGNTITLDIPTVTVNDVTLTAGTLNINTGNALTINGNLTQNGTFTINSDANGNGSLIVKGTSTGNISYLKYLTTNRYLIASPADGPSITSLAGQVTIRASKYSIASYENDVPSAFYWDYYTTNLGTNDIATAGNFETAKGYSIQKSTPGTINLTGTLNTDNSGENIAITDGGDYPDGNRWNLIGNPYTASLHGNNAADATNNFLKVNIDANNLDPNRAGMYVWTGTSPYEIKSIDDAAFYVAPGDAFFVYAPDGGGTSASFIEDMQTHQTLGSVMTAKSSINYPEIILQLTDASDMASTKIRYIENKTTDLDVGSDVGTFTGDGVGFNVFTHLLTNSNGVDFAIQALPNAGYENMVVPVGVYADAGKEITFSLETSNFSSDLKLFLEDRITNTFARLDQANSSYKVTLTESLNGIGRFYLHTTSSSLSVDTTLALNSASIYKLDNATLRIAGLPKGNATIIIFNLLGKQVMNTSFTTNGVQDIAIPKFAKGVYIVQLKTASGQLNKKIILE